MGPIIEIRGCEMGDSDVFGDRLTAQTGQNNG